MVWILEVVFRWLLFEAFSRLVARPLILHEGPTGLFREMPTQRLEERNGFTMSAERA